MRWEIPRAKLALLVRGAVASVVVRCTAERSQHPESRGGAVKRESDPCQAEPGPQNSVAVLIQASKAWGSSVRSWHWLSLVARSSTSGHTAVTQYALKC